MSRLLTFGCSFTNYRWSTWADILAPEFDQFENWGQGGGGNHYIFNSLMEADQRQRFGPNDTVVVCWSSTFRDDRYIKDRWITLGQINHCNIYTKDFITNGIDDRGTLIRDLAFVKAAAELLENRPGVNWKFISICPIASTRYWGIEDDTQHDVVELYKSVIDKIDADYVDFLRRFSRDNRYKDDPHPTPIEHLGFLDEVFPGWVTKQETRVKIREEQNNIRLNRTSLSTVTRL
jgi:hypothetical protein